MDDMPQNVKWAVCLLYTVTAIEVLQTIIYTSEMNRMTIGLLVHCFFLVVIYRISKGRNWARVFYLVSVIFVLLFAVGAALHGFEVPAHRLPTTTGGIILGLTEKLAEIVATVLLFIRPASQWFQDKGSFA